MTITRRYFKEIASGWIDKRSGHIFKTATAAKRAAKREAKANRNGGDIGAVVVEWEPTTKIGRIIVNNI